jgi:transposase-like protein
LKDEAAMTNLTAPIFTDANSAREHLEALYWPTGPVCRHCGNADANRIKKLKGKSTRPGVYWCNECDAPFSVTVGTVMEDSKIPLNKWVLAFQLMASSKKGMSAHQLHRMLGVTYKTAWFLCHRIREAMNDPEPNKNGGPLGGKDKVVEADETLIGGGAKNRAHGEPAPKKAVVTLVERDGRARSKHVANIDAKHIRPFVMKNTSRKSTLHTDGAAYYTRMGREFADHKAVDHSRSEYAYRLDGKTVTTNHAENYFSILKRGIYGVYHSVSEAHMSRYLAEFDFRYSTRAKLGFSDDERADLAVKGAEGKRLTYNQPAN